MAVIADSTSFKTAYPKSVMRRLGLTGFGHWWRGELAAAMPARLSTMLERRHARPVLAFDGSTATLWRPTTHGRMQMSEVARIALDGDVSSVAASGRAALAPLVRAANGARPRIVVTLSPRTALRKTLTLPMALEDHLHQSLAYDLDRHTPFKPEELYFDAVVVDRDGAHNTLRVDLAAARRGLVDTILGQAESFGARVVAATVDPPATASMSRINLLPEDRRPTDSGYARWQVIVPLAVLVVGALAALFLPIWQKRGEAIALNELSDQARERAGISEALRTELERRVSDYNFALARKYAFPGTVQVLDDVTRILPDDTWLTQFELHTMRGKDVQREVNLRGESANAGRLVSLLEDSKIFTQAAPRSPTTKIQPGPGEIFDVGAHLTPKPAPAAMPLDVTAPQVRLPPAAARSTPSPGATSATAQRAPAPASATIPGASAKNPAPSATNPTASSADRPAAVGAPAPAPAASAEPASAPAVPAPTRTPGTLPPGTHGVARAPPTPAVNPGNVAAPAPAPFVPAPEPEPNDGFGPREDGQ
jgi:general secretion pathway protein L